jgi:hypothetical protein
MSSVDTPPGTVNARTPVPPVPADVYDVEQLDDEEVIALAHRMASGAVTVTQDVGEAVEGRLIGVNMIARWRGRRRAAVPEAVPNALAVTPESTATPVAPRPPAPAEIFGSPEWAKRTIDLALRQVAEREATRRVHGRPPDDLAATADALAAPIAHHPPAAAPEPGPAAHKPAPPLPDYGIIPGPEHFGTAVCDMGNLDPGRGLAEDENITPDETPEPEPPLPHSGLLDGGLRPARPATTPTAMPALRDVVVPSPVSSDPEDVARDRRVTRCRLDAMAGATRLAARFGSPDPVAEAACSEQAYNSPLARYVFVKLVAERDDLAAKFLPEAVADYKARRSVIDLAIPGLLPTELLEAAAPPAAAPVPAITPAEPTTTPTAPPIDRRLTRYAGWIVPQTVLDTYAISKKAAAAQYDRFEKDAKKTRTEVPREQLAAEWQRRVAAGKVLWFGSADVADHMKGLRDDYRASPRRTTPRPSHITKQEVDARRQELWDEYEEAKKAPKPQSLSGRRPSGNKQPRVVEKLAQAREFATWAKEKKLKAQARHLWRVLWAHEGRVNGALKRGHVAESQEQLMEEMGVGESTIKRATKALIAAGLLFKTGEPRKGVTATEYMITYRPDHWDWIADQTTDGAAEG